MENSKKIAVFIAGFLAVGIFIAVAFPKEGSGNPDAAIRIGAGDDISGILAQETAEELKDGYAVSSHLENTSFQDC